MKSTKILVVGSLIEDLISKTKRVPNSGESFFGKGFSKAPGGKGANQAVAAARLGGDVSFIGKTGDDIFSNELLFAVRESGIDTTKILRQPNKSSGCSLIAIEELKEGNANRILVNPESNLSLTINNLKYLEKEIKNYGALVLQFEIPMAVNEYLAELAHKNGVFVVVNPAPYTKMSEKLLKNIDLLIPNEHEASDIAGLKITNGKTVNKDEVKKCGQAINKLGVKNVIITLGHNGSALINKEGCFFTKAVQGIKSVDPTAAGDSYLGSLVASYINGMSLKDSMDAASYVSAIVVTKMGAMPSIPYLDEVIALMKKDGKTALANKLLAKFKPLPSMKERISFFKKSVTSETKNTLANLNLDSLEKAMNLILHAEANGNRVHITGIGKPSHVAEYLASLMSSTGTPTYYLHGTECVHGSAGQLVPGDIVIAISNSGETLELKATLNAVKANNCLVIGVSGNKESWLAKNSDAFLLAHVDEEGGPLNKAPRTSILSEIIVLQALSVMLQSHKKILPVQYKTWHPGGKLGGTY